MPKRPKAVYFFNASIGKDYFRFTEYRFGPYCPAIEPMLATIRDYLDYSSLSPNDLITDAVYRKLAGPDVDRFDAWCPGIEWAVEISNRAGSLLEGIATVHAVVSKHGPIEFDELAKRFLEWSPEKAQRFDSSDVRRALDFLLRENVLRSSLFGVEAGSRDAWIPRLVARA